VKNLSLIAIAVIAAGLLFMAQSAGAAPITSDVAIETTEPPFDVWDLPANTTINAPLQSGDIYWDWDNGAQVSVTPMWDPSVGSFGSWRLGSDDGLSGPVWTFWPAVWGTPYSFYATEILYYDMDPDIIHRVFFGTPSWPPANPAESIPGGSATLITPGGIDADLILFEYANNPFDPDDNTYDAGMDSGDMVQLITAEQESPPEDPDPVPEPATMFSFLLAGLGFAIKRFRK